MRLQVSTVARFTTSVENIVLRLAFESVGEEQYNRTTAEYMDIAARLPPVKVLHGYVNDRLAEIWKSGHPPYEICRFLPGDISIRYEPFPKEVSIETVRSALNLSGMRHPGRRRKSQVIDSIDIL